MSPPAMIDNQEPAINGHTAHAPASKIATMPHTTSIPVKGVTKRDAIEDMAGNWADFKFAPIRESQVSRSSK